ncbi:LacI family transcriptional regulator [Brachybacterium endophyticum]|uniref:LacI family transcriptional regulator n=2 Tax=Brachybacterium endophyticum TaxID=2182385 RepID=A0A2U2RPB5_9MICO|nr:LacI family transcriptional regulator [Brachybacterium endophyticum]
MGRRVSIKDVARTAGVSWKTVSNVVNDRPVVREETRRRVEQAIADLGYVPNTVGRELRGGPTRLISLVLPELENPYFARLAQALHVAAKARGYGVSVELTLGNVDVERAHVRGRVSRPVDAVIISPDALDPAEIRERGDGPPLVLLGERLLGAAGIAHVAVDNVEASADVVRHLVERGYRHPVFLGGESEQRSAGTDRLAGFRAACRASGIPSDAAHIAHVDAWDMAEGRRAVLDLLTGGIEVDAIAAANDQLALGALAVLRESGRDVPGDVGVVGWDDTPGSRHSAPLLSTVSPDMDDLVAAALDAAVGSEGAGTAADGSADGEGNASGEHVVPYRLLVRESSSGPRT